jgi:arylsulfatase A-like enzyme
MAFTLGWRLAILLALSLGGWKTAAADRESRPNFVFILCDDLGYGDVQANHPAGKIRTPNVDRIAREGLRFTDAHSPSSVCTPTRYSLLTGRYNWRSRLQSGVLGGLSRPLIEPGRLTVAEMLRRQGYHTACIGKWHLGLDWVKRDGQLTPPENGIENSNQVWNVDYRQPFANGPTTMGFDHFFGISASLDMVPYTFLQNDRVTVVPTVERTFPFRPDVTEKNTRKGPATPEFDVSQVLPTLTQKAVGYIRDRAEASRRGTPFFLYLPLNSPHTPIAPTAAWLGKSGLGPYADFVMETDWAVGQVLEALSNTGQAGQTVVIFTSDNGCSPEAGIPELHEQGHDVNGPLRGHKADIWEGGHRIPFLVSWPGRIKPGTTCTQLVSLVDFMATAADITGFRLPDTAGEDSVSLLPLLSGKLDQPVREALVHHSINGRFAIRQGPWKLALCPGSGGWSLPRDPEAVRQQWPAVQLYRMDADLAEQGNQQAEHPEVVQRLSNLLEQYVTHGRSTPGRPQTNTTLVRWRPTAPAIRPSK